MDKRGQIYVLVALILALVLYMLMTKTNLVYEQDIVDDFETLSKNYDIEASRFMNSLLSQTDITGEKIKNDFNRFTCDFSKYAKNQNPDFSLIYVFRYGENLYIGNYLRNPIIVNSPDGYLLFPGCGEGAVIGFHTEIGPGEGSTDICNCVEPIPARDELEVTIGSSLYIIKVKGDRPEIVIVSREDKGDQRKVYTEEEFVGGSAEKEAVSGTDYCKGKSRESSSDMCSSSKEIICEKFNEFKEACEFDEKCCWEENEGGGECRKKEECST